MAPSMNKTTSSPSESLPDFYSYRVLSVKEDGSDQRLEAEVPNQPSGLGWLPDGRLLVVSSAYQASYLRCRLIDPYFDGLV